MSRSNKHFDEFKAHSKHKHVLLKHYFDAWGHKLGLRGGAGNTILYVDACAGSGIDGLGNHGSPLIAARGGAIAQSNVGERRSVSFRIQIVAIEVDEARYKTLSKLLAPFGTSARALRGTLADHIASLESEFPSMPALYFIDPFGLDPLQAEVVRRALAGERHEILLLFADQAALRHVGAIIATETRAEKQHRKATSELSLFPDENEKHIEALAQTASKSRGSLKITQEHAERILNAAFGDGDWLSAVQDTPKASRRNAFIRLYSDRLRSWGATHILEIPIVDESDNHAYTLIHASKSSKAYATMKEAVSFALKNSPLPIDVVEHMRRLVRTDLPLLERKIRRHFASQRVRWTADPNEKFAPCVKAYVLEETGTFPFELDELKQRLNRFKVPGAAIVYSFPEEPSDVD
jgi:three-Cys-motif partner protein